jgi:transcriptional regulator with XRE-family HTH domain
MMLKRVVPFGQYIIERGFEQRDFAFRAGIRQATVSGIVSGRTNPQQCTRRRIMLVLGISEDELDEMIVLSWELAAADEMQRRFGRRAGQLCSIARHIQTPGDAVIGIARSARRVLLKLIRRQRGRYIMRLR